MSDREGFDAVTRFVEENLEFATSHYNDSYLQRRIKSRMRRTESDDYMTYLRLLQSDADEHARLLDSLSINVTGFFRNPDVWDGIRDVLRTLDDEHNGIRIWSAGCADGREPYSLAVLALSDPEIDASKVSILGTDINERALALAEHGVYESNHTSDLDEQLAYLPHHGSLVERDGERFRVTEEVKRRVTFEKHDLIRDDVSRRYEMVVCRNLFIYIDPEYKAPVIENILDGLRPEGYLAIGKAETLPPSAAGEFEVIDSRKRIYRRARPDE